MRDPHDYPVLPELGETRGYPETPEEIRIATTFDGFKKFSVVQTYIPTGETWMLDVYFYSERAFLSTIENWNKCRPDLWKYERSPR